MAIRSLAHKRAVGRSRAEPAERESCQLAAGTLAVVANENSQLIGIVPERGEGLPIAGQPLLRRPRRCGSCYHCNPLVTLVKDIAGYLARSSPAVGQNCRQIESGAALVDQHYRAERSELEQTAGRGRRARQVDNSVDALAAQQSGVSRLGFVVSFGSGQHHEHVPLRRRPLDALGEQRKELVHEVGDEQPDGQS